jgi:hypothetical protein
MLQWILHIALLDRYCSSILISRNQSILLVEISVELSNPFNSTMVKSCCNPWPLH